MTRTLTEPDTTSPVVATLPRQGHTSPPAKRKRLVGVDAARGVALLGMIAVHALYMYDDAGQPTWSFTIFGGRAAAAFAVLAGVGIAFMTGRRRVRLSGGLATVRPLASRALVIGAIGLVLGYTDAEVASVILPYYAVMFMLAIPLLFLPTWTVATIGVLMAAGMPALSHVLIPHLPDPVLRNATFGYLVNDPVGLLAELSITGEYPALPWMAYLCAGLIIGRMDLTRARVATALLGTGIALAVGAAAASSILLGHYGGLERIWAAQPHSLLTISETTDVLTLGADGTLPTSTWWWLAVDSPHTSAPLDLLGTTGTAVALLGVMLLVGHLTHPILHGLIIAVQAPLAAAGSMTLTFYTAHLLFINSDYDIFSSTTGYLVQAVAVLLIGLSWRATVGRGPLEMLVLTLSRTRSGRRDR